MATDIRGIKFYATLLIVGILVFLFFVIGIMVVIFARRITNPIMVLTRFTQKLKQAESNEKKRQVLQEVKLDVHFEDIQKQYV